MEAINNALNHKNKSIRIQKSQKTLETLDEGIIRDIAATTTHIAIGIVNGAFGRHFGLNHQQFEALLSTTIAYSRSGYRNIVKFVVAVWGGHKRYGLSGFNGGCDF